MKSIITFLLACLSAVAGTPTNISLGSAPNPSNYGQSVNLMATVTPTAATGKVTFYDGTTVLGTAPVVSGMAQVSTILLPSGGTRSLRAYYGGDATYNPSVSSNVPQTVNASPATAFVQTVPYLSTTIDPGYFPAVGDFNGDGKADVVTVTTTGVVRVFLGDGNGGMTPAGAAPVNLGGSNGNPVYSLAVGDFNGDGKLDVAVGAQGVYQSTPGKLYVLLGDGNGGLSNAGGSPYPVGTVGAFAFVTSGDFNGDGKTDLAVATTNPTTSNGSLYILLGNGAGSFTATAASPVTLSIPAAYITTGDFNNDGKTDLAIALKVFDGDWRLGIFLGDGSGGFTQAGGSPYMLGGVVGAIAVADFNGDGNQDVAGGTGVVMLGNGTGGFSPGPGASSSHCQPAYSFFALDVNGDGKTDLICGGSRSVTADPAYVGVLSGDGLGGFTDAGYYVGPNLERRNFTNAAIALGDFNGDGKVDVVSLGPDFDVPNAFGISLLLGTTAAKLNFTTQPANGTVGTPLANVRSRSWTRTASPSPTLPLRSPSHRIPRASRPR